MPVDIGFITGIVISGIIIIGVIGNVMTLFVIIRYKPLRNETGMFLANLAVADLLQSIIGMPLIAASAFHKLWLFGESLCVISGLTNSLFCVTSVLTLTAVSVDRWLSIVYPLQYRNWLTVRRARFTLVYIWIHALFVAILPVFGWSRYVYLPYEFICTVQWESDKCYTMFLSATSFVTPVIVVVLCYSSVLKTARRKAREEPRVTVGRFSGSNVKPGTSSTEEAFDKNCDNSGKYVRGNENHVFISNSKKRWEKSVFEECYIGPEKSESTSLKMEEHHDEIERDSELSSTSTIRKKETKRKSSSRVVPSSTSGVAQLNTVVAAKGCSKMAGKGKHPKNFSTSSSRRTGTSRVNKVDVAAPVINRWTEDISLRKETTVIPEETEGKRYPLSRTITATAGLPEPLARMRGWMNERKKGDGRHKRKEMKITFILLVVNGTFLLCWFPHFIGMMCLTFTNGLCPFPDSYHIITTTLAMLNSGCNPFIYTLTYRKFRSGFQAVIPCFRSHNAAELENSVD